MPPTGLNPKSLRLRHEPCDDVPTDPLPATGAQAGVDVGSGDVRHALRRYRRSTIRGGRVRRPAVEVAQRRLAARQRGSNNRVARRETVAARHRKIANRRKDFHHKQARELVARYDLLVVEDLKIANMLRRAKPKPDPDNPDTFLPNGARAKSGLNRSISDAGWGQFVSILRAKAEEAGRTWIEIDPRHTSRQV